LVGHGLAGRRKDAYGVEHRVDGHCENHIRENPCAYAPDTLEA